MDVLEKLFSSPAQVKVMRLFLYNPDFIFDSHEIQKKTQLSPRAMSKEIHRLESAFFLKQRSIFKPAKKNTSKRKQARKMTKGWVLNRDFPYLEQFRDLLMSFQKFERAAIAKRFSRAGKIKLLAISGVFLRSEFSRVDILLVGDNLRPAIITQAFKAIEATIGKSLRYSVLDTKDFLYRLSVCDKFIRDVLDYPHEKLIDKFGLR